MVSYGPAFYYPVILSRRSTTKDLQVRRPVHSEILRSVQDDVSEEAHLRLPSQELRADTAAAQFFGEAPRAVRHVDDARA